MKGQTTIMIACIYTMDTDSDSGIMLVKTFDSANKVIHFEHHAIVSLQPVLHLIGSHIMSNPKLTNPTSLQEIDPYFKQFKPVDSLKEFLTYRDQAQQYFTDLTNKIKDNHADQKVKYH